MKKIGGFLLSLVLFCSFIGIKPAYAAGGAVNITVTGCQLDGQNIKGQVKKGDSITITFTAKDIRDLYSIDATYKYDTDLLDIESAKVESTVYGNSGKYEEDKSDASKSTARVIFTLMGASTAAYSGSDDIVKITATAKKDGELLIKPADVCIKVCEKNAAGEIDNMPFTQQYYDVAVNAKEPDGTENNGSGLGEGETINSDGSITKADGTIEKSDGTVVSKDGTVTKADGTVIKPDGTIVKADGTVVEPEKKDEAKDDSKDSSDEENSSSDEETNESSDSTDEAKEEKGSHTGLYVGIAIVVVIGIIVAAIVIKKKKDNE